MNTVRRITATLASFACTTAVLTIAAMSASAFPNPGPDDSGGSPPASVTTVVHHGSSVWSFVLVAAIAVVMTAAIIALALRLRGSRKLQLARRAQLSHA
jgi:hypothetical protein